MKTIHEIAGVLGAVVALALWAYLGWKHIQSIYTKDLGDGGIQTLFGSKKRM